jgi:hypothetical protein
MIRCVFFLLLFFLVSCTKKSTEVAEASKDSTQQVASDLPATQPTANFSITILESSNWNLTIDTITAADFDESKQIAYREPVADKDSLMKVFATTYSKSIILDDSCCTIRTNEKDVRFCNRRPPNDRLWTGYEATEFHKGYLIIMDWWYEGGHYMSFDPLTKKYCFTRGQPVFINQDLVYSAGSTYGVGEFELIDLKSDKYFIFDSEELIASYWEHNAVYLKFSARDNSKLYRRIQYAP